MALQRAHAGGTGQGVLGAEANEVKYPLPLRKLDEWLPGDPIKVRFFADAFANQRGVVQVVEVDHCQVLLRAREQPTDIQKTDPIYGETAIIRASSLTKAGQIVDRSHKIGGHWE